MWLQCRQHEFAVALHSKTLRMVAAGFDDGRLRIFDTAAAALAAEIRQHRGALQAASFAADGARLYTAGSDGVIGVLDVMQVGVSALVAPPQRVPILSRGS